MPTRSGTGWTSPSIIVAALSIASSAGWAYVAMSREDNRELVRQIRDHDRDIASLKAQVEFMRERPDGGTR